VSLIDQRITIFSGKTFIFAYAPQGRDCFLLAIKLEGDSQPVINRGANIIPAVIENDLNSIDLFRYSPNIRVGA